MGGGERAREGRERDREEGRGGREGWVGDPLCEILNTPLDVVARIRNSIFGRPWFLTSSATKTPAPAPFILSNDLITSCLSRTAPLLTTPTRRLAEINLANRTHSITVIINQDLM